MLKRNFRTVAGSCGIALILIGLVNLDAQDKNEGFVDLLNDTDLSGWTISKENPDSYTVKDGVMIVKGGRSHIFLAPVFHVFTN